MTSSSGRGQCVSLPQEGATSSGCPAGVGTGVAGEAAPHQEPRKVPHTVPAVSPTHPPVHPTPLHAAPEPHAKLGTAPSWLCSPGRAGRQESSDVEAAPASRPWFYPVVEQHDVTYHRVKPLAGHRESWSRSGSRGSSPTKGTRRAWGGSGQGHANPAPRRCPR